MCPFPDQRGFAQLEGRIHPWQVRHFLLAETQINRLWQLGGRPHSFTGFKIVRWCDDGNVVDGAQSGIVMQRVVGGSERPVTNTRTDSNRVNRSIRVAKVVLELLKRTCGQKTSRRNLEDLLPGCG